MKKLGLILVLAVLLSACGADNEVKEYDKENQINLQASETDILNMSFEKRTASFLDKKEEFSQSDSKNEFANIRLAKVDGYYELKADLIGEAIIEANILDNALKEIKANNLDQIAVNVGKEKAIIYSRKPQEITDWHEKVKKQLEEQEFAEDFSVTGIPTYDDGDWISAKNNEEWLDSNGIPMYVSLRDFWVRLTKEDEGYHLYDRGLIPGIAVIKESNAICIKLLGEDKISLDSSNYFGYITKDYESKVVTVEEYYNISLKNGADYRTSDGFYINIDNMSGANDWNSGLNISDGMIHVSAKYDGP